jgi:mannose-6-phosphate isomerase-like protein (cupin superfamily)
MFQQRFNQGRIAKAYLWLHHCILKMDKREEKRPWGGYQIIDIGSSFKAKRIWVKLGHRLSYQKHLQRSEHWVLIEGKAKVTLDGNEILLKAGQAIDIPQGSAHRIENIGENPLSLIEIQMGKNLSENDVIRLEDDYGRAGHPLKGGSP